MLVNLLAFLVLFPSRTFQVGGSAGIGTFTEGFQALSFSPDGKDLATVTGLGRVRVWELSTQKLLLKFEGPPTRIQGDRFTTSLEYSRDGRHLLAARCDKTARMWSAETGKLEVTFAGHKGNVMDAVFSPDGSTVLTGSMDGTARLWRADSGALLWSVPSGDRVLAVGFSNDGKYAITRAWQKSDLGDSNDPIAKLWDAHTGSLIKTFVGGSQDGMCMAVDPTQDEFALSMGVATTVWSISTGKKIGAVPGDSGGVESISFSPNGSELVTGSVHGDATLWDASSFIKLKILPGDASSVNAVAFSPDGRYIATGKDNGFFQIWQASTGQLIATFQNSPPYHTNGG
jgi:WD40 repeat protein